MTVFRRVNLEVSEPGNERSSKDVMARLTRGVGRLLLWGCVLLLLLRGTLAILRSDPGVGGAARPVMVTVTQPADTEPPPAEGK
jgi:hypothetical protein